MRKILPGCLTVLSLLAAGCARGPERAAAIGEAYAGPAQLRLRKDIPLESPVVGSAKHGDRLEILKRHRKFLRVRAPGGTEGWIEERLLLRAEDMTALKDLTATAAKLPSQGKATIYGELNVHTQPQRQSPSFIQVKEGEKLDVLVRRLADRASAPRRPLIPPPPKKAAPPKKHKPAKEVKYPPPPMPKPPGATPDWLELSRRAAPEELEEPEEEPAEPSAPTPIPKDDWSLVRTSSGQAGWALTRRLVMAIPDEVAQYAEGRRITSYFALGTVRDGDEERQQWLWTTLTGGAEGYDFDSFRVFVWSLRRHRYETAYIERNLKGYAPVMLERASPSAGGRGKGPGATTYPGFSVCTEKRDGQRYRRAFAFLEGVVRSAGERPCEAPPALPGETAVAERRNGAAEPSAAEVKEPFWQRFKKRLRGLAGGRFGG